MHKGFCYFEALKIQYVLLRNVQACFVLLIFMPALHNSQIKDMGNDSKSPFLKH